MRKVYLIIFFIGYQISCAQTGINTPWTWVNGDSTTGQLGIYGIQGIASTLNKPGGRDNSFTWTDAAGNLWLFGGHRYGVSAGYLNDLWKYTVASGEWTWMKGSSTVSQLGIYGIQGVSNSANTPGARAFGACWIDDTGNLWLFGGLGFGESGNGKLNDLWKYNPISNEWTWMKGNKTIDGLPVYGTQGISSFSNTPGSRYGVSGWKDSNGIFWLFGGEGKITPLLGGYLNELWKFNPANIEWTWVNGSSFNQNGVYGVQGVSNISNKPGSRVLASSWVDNLGNFLILGGFGYSYNSVGTEVLNDLWKYNAVNNEWTWMKGDSIGNQPCIFGTQGVANVINKPGGRDEACTWKDANGDLWLFGGYDTNGKPLNDFWKYEISSNNWIWIKGDTIGNQYGFYGSLGISQITNKPGGRYGAVSWTDNLYNFWIFGGRGYAGSGIKASLNDLWSINSNELIPLTLLDFKGSIVRDENFLYWQTSQEINSDVFVVERSSDARNFNVIGSVETAGNSSVTKNYFFSDKQPLPNINFYRLKILDNDGKFTYSKCIAIKRTNDFDILLFPNPANDILFIQFKAKKGSAVLQIIDAGGKKIKENNIILNENSSFSINVERFAKGTYQLLIKTTTKIFQQKFVIP